jgi:hypothetical protein
LTGGAVPVPTQPDFDQSWQLPQIEEIDFAKLPE